MTPEKLFYEVATPKRILLSTEEEDMKKYLQVLNANNGVKNIYRTIYNFRARDGFRAAYRTAIIDKIAFDFDFDDQNKEIVPYDEAKRLVDYLWEQGLVHEISSSSAGRYHIYIHCEIRNHSDSEKKQMLRNAQLFYINLLKLNCDPHIVGDLARIMRVTDTYNVKRKSYCVSLSREEFCKGDEFCKSLTKTQRMKRFLIGEKKIEIEKIAYQSSSFLKRISASIEGNVQAKIKEFDHDKLFKSLPDCAKRSLVSEPYYRERFLLIMTLKETCGFVQEETEALFKKYFPKYLYDHCVLEEKQVDYLYKTDQMRPAFITLVDEGFCQENCDCKKMGTYLGDN